MARVLVIEDEPNIKMVLEIILMEEGHIVMTASDGLSALEQLNHTPAPDIAFVDLHIPVLGGKGIIEKMRSNPVLSNVPVVIMTGSIHNSKDFPPKEYYNALIAKPFDIFEVIDTVENLTFKKIKPAI